MRLLLSLVLYARLEERRLKARFSHRMNFSVGQSEAQIFSWLSVTLSSRDAHQLFGGFKILRKIYSNLCLFNLE